MNDKLENEIAEALEHLNPASLNYSEWVSVGMALKNEGFPADTWESWSASDPERYHPGECLKKWNTFERSGTGKGTIFLLCKQHSGHTVSGSRYKYSGEIAEETIIDDPGLIRWTEPGQDWNPLEDMQKYISVLFNPAEYVGYCVNSRQDQKTGKYIPKTGGNYDRTAERLLRELSSAERIEDVFLDYDKNAGAWIRFNPLDGNGAKDANITDYRFTLIESDNMPINEQIQKYIDLQLPIAALVHSGGKSAHAIVRINAKSKEEYNSRIDLLYSELKRNGFETDTQNRNPSRLSRAPGFLRNGKKQYLIAVNIGAPSWEAWAAGREETETDLEIPSFDDIEEKEIEWLIPKYIPKEQITMLCGTGGTGKTSVWVSLAAALSSGTKNLLDGDTPFESIQREPLKILVFSAEDDAAVTLKRKIRKQGGTMGNIRTILIGDERFDLIHFGSKYLEKLLKKYRPALCVFDPLQAFIDKKIKMSDRNAIRQNMRYLIEWGNKYGTTFLIVMHTNKLQNAWGRNRMADSADLWDIARSVLMVGDTENDEIKYMSHEKSNYGKPGKTLLFKNLNGFATWHGWTDEKDRDFVTALAKKRNTQKESGTLEEVKEFILSALTDYPDGLTSQELVSLLRDAGFKQWAIEKGKSELKIQKQIVYKRTGKKDPWIVKKAEKA